MNINEVLTKELRELAENHPAFNWTCSELTCHSFVNRVFARKFKTNASEINWLKYWFEKLNEFGFPLIGEFIHRLKKSFENMGVIISASYDHTVSMWNYKAIFNSVDNDTVSKSIYADELTAITSAIIYVFSNHLNITVNENSIN